MINKVILVGNVGADPDYRALDGGNRVVRLRLATTEKYKTNDGTKEQTEWHNIEAWQNLADIIDKWVKKGDKLYVEGSIRTRTYKDKDGVDKFSTSIIAKEIKILSPKDAPKEKKENVIQGKMVQPRPVEAPQAAPQSNPAPAEIPLPPLGGDGLPF
jgi:single-strand DNA-binding protein